MRIYHLKRKISYTVGKNGWLMRRSTTYSQKGKYAGGKIPAET